MGCHHQSARRKGQRALIRAAAIRVRPRGSLEEAAQHLGLGHVAPDAHSHQLRLRIQRGNQPRGGAGRQVPELQPPTPLGSVAAPGRLAWSPATRTGRCEGVATLVVGDIQPGGRLAEGSQGCALVRSAVRQGQKAMTRKQQTCVRTMRWLSSRTHASRCARAATQPPSDARSAFSRLFQGQGRPPGECCG